jgi:hypothetical protein
MGSYVKVTYVALNTDRKPIVSANEFDDLKAGVDEYYGVNKGQAEYLGFTPYYSKFPETYEGYFTYKDGDDIDEVKVYCIDYWPHTIYET